MRKARLSALIAAMLTFSAMSGCASEAFMPPPVSEARTLDAAAYAEEMGVSLEEANRRLSQQDPIGDLQIVLAGNEPDRFGGLYIQHEPEYGVVVQVTGGKRRIFRRYVHGGPLEGVVTMREVDATLAELESAQTVTMAILGEIGSGADSGIDIQGNCVVLYVADPAAFGAQLNAAGVALPDHVCITPAGPYAQAPPLALPPGLAFPRQIPPEGLLVEMQALLIGELVDENGCLRVASDGDTDYLIVWPYDHTVTLSGDGSVEISDGSGTVVARVGDIVRVGGGESSSVADAIVVGGCHGPYWIASRGIEGTRLDALPQDIDVAPLLDDLAALGVLLGEPEESKAALLYPDPGIVYRMGHSGWLHLHLFPSEQIAHVRADSLAQELPNAIIDWVDRPTFYRCGRVIALYLGTDDGVKWVLGARCTQFAGLD